MENLPKDKPITNSLLFFLLRDSLPRGTAFGFEYTIDEFNRYRNELIKRLHEFLDGIDSDEEKILEEKEARDEVIFKEFIVRPIDYKLKEILIKDYHHFFRRSSESPYCPHRPGLSGIVYPPGP